MIAESPSEESTLNAREYGFSLEFSTSNAAFGDNNDRADRTEWTARAEEIARILEAVAARVRNGEDCGNCHDYNGNTVGKWRDNS